MRQFELSCCGIKVNEGKIPYECRGCGSTSFHQLEVDKKDRVITACGGYSGDISHEVRPWGSFRNLIDRKGYKVKEILVKPQQRLSLQLHKHRSEYWYILSGDGEMQVGGAIWTVSAGDKVEIQKLEVHRIANEGDTPLIILEIQTGDCQEDDIIRIQDDYGRTE